MLDIKKIINETEEVKAKLLKKGCEVNLDEVIKLDIARRQIISTCDELKKERNTVSAQVPAMKKAGEDVTAVFTRMKAIGEEIASYDVQINELELKINGIVAALPNLPDDDVPAGGKEANEVVKVVGTKPEFDFKPEGHVELCTKLKLIDYERGVKLAGGGNWLYRGKGSLLEWALINFFLEEHRNDGYEMVIPPLMLSYNAGYGSGQFPKFKEDVFWVEQDEDVLEQNRKFLLPTSETALVNLYANEIIAESSLPLKLCAYTPCFRKEAGSYRSEERGMIRGHQFNKVEMVQITTPDKSKEAFEELVGKACGLVEKLGLHYRLSRLAAGDCSHSMARTYDIEIWIPSMGIYKEVSSVSNAGDYQARRNGTRYRNEQKKTEFVHTLNGSGLATSRLVPAIVEQFQNADGSVTVPEVLRKWTGFDKITL